ncbi:hypothetical protein GSI_02666 [Ganoderma sinense ZZ0214-1]|uniref:Uncharacterized protein n=1 Tax=Ganoderma sinense ZZ0214-1 TaxID=1077348 RepID=A0A2G8SMB1_9APHY|nr:hypothetical protein GSI_02666 [Ganoderma sinense ZZ0214-1]
MVLFAFIANLNLERDERARQPMFGPAKLRWARSLRNTVSSSFLAQGSRAPALSTLHDDIEMLCTTLVPSRAAHLFCQITTGRDTARAQVQSTVADGDERANRASTLRSNTVDVISDNINSNWESSQPRTAIASFEFEPDGDGRACPPPPTAGLRSPSRLPIYFGIVPRSGARSYSFEWVIAFRGDNHNDARASLEASEDIWRRAEW